MGMGGQRHTPAALTQEQPGTHCVGGWVPWSRSGQVRKISPTGIRSPDPPARSESLQGLSYPGRLGLYLVKCQLFRNPSNGEAMVRKRA